MAEKPLSLRRAILEDSEFLLKLRNDPVVRESSTNTNEVAPEDHSIWYAKKRNDPNTYFFIVLLNGERVGQTKVDIQKNYGIISIAISKEYRGKGLGSMAISDTCISIFSENQIVEEIFAYIKLENTASLKSFMRVGFCQDDIIELDKVRHHKMVLRKKEYLLGQLDALHYKPPFPQVLRIEPASACNFKCIHCPTGLDMNPNTGIMSMNTFNKVLKKIEDRHFRVIVMYHGGEPFLNPNLLEMAKRLRPLAERIEMNSNASILTGGIIDKILDADAIDRISFSIDGNSPEENDKIRVGANFHKIAANIKRLINARNELGLKRPKIFIANTQIPETQSTGKIEIPKFLKEVFGEMESEINYKCTYALIWAGMSIKPGAIKPDNNFCDHIVNTFTIRANGDVVACCYDLTTEMLMGNVLEQSLEEIWHGKKYIGLRKAIASFNPPKLCRGCEVLYPQAVMTRKDIKIV